jgi:hypothetical protein
MTSLRLEPATYWRGITGIDGVRELLTVLL